MNIDWNSNNTHAIAVKLALQLAWNSGQLGNTIAPSPRRVKIDPTSLQHSDPAHKCR
jgi:hypothetical protein